MIPQAEEKYSHDELQLMKTQDIKYVQMKLSTEKKVRTSTLVLQLPAVLMSLPLFVES